MIERLQHAWATRPRHLAGVTRYDVGFMPGPVYLDRQGQAIATSVHTPIVWWLTATEMRTVLDHALVSVLDHDFHPRSIPWLIPYRVWALMTGAVPCFECHGTGREPMLAVLLDMRRSGGADAASLGTTVDCRWCRAERERISRRDAGIATRPHP